MNDTVILGAILVVLMMHGLSVSWWMNKLHEQMKSLDNRLRNIEGHTDKDQQSPFYNRYLRP